MAEPPINRRTTVRAPLRCAAHIELSGGATREAALLDIGLQGLSLVTARPIAPGTRCILRFELPQGDAGQAMALPARVVHSSYTGPATFRIGLVFGTLEASQAAAIEAYASA
jgi:hypothetical protein